MRTTVETTKEDINAFKEACKELNINIIQQEKNSFTVDYNFAFSLFYLGQLTQIKSIKIRR